VVLAAGGEPANLRAQRAAAALRVVAVDRQGAGRSPWADGAGGIRDVGGDRAVASQHAARAVRQGYAAGIEGAATADGQRAGVGEGGGRGDSEVGAGEVDGAGVGMGSGSAI